MRLRERYTKSSHDRSMKIERNVCLPRSLTNWLSDMNNYLLPLKSMRIFHNYYSDQQAHTFCPRKHGTLTTLYATTTPEAQHAHFLSLPTFTCTLRACTTALLPSSGMIPINRWCYSDPTYTIGLAAMSMTAPAGRAPAPPSLVRWRGLAGAFFSSPHGLLLFPLQRHPQNLPTP